MTHTFSLSVSGSDENSALFGEASIKMEGSTEKIALMIADIAKKDPGFYTLLERTYYHAARPGHIFLLSVEKTMDKAEEYRKEVEKKAYERLKQEQNESKPHSDAVI